MENTKVDPRVIIRMRFDQSKFYAITNEYGYLRFESTRIEPEEYTHLLIAMNAMRRLMRAEYPSWEFSFYTSDVGRGLIRIYLEWCDGNRN